MASTSTTTLETRIIEIAAVQVGFEPNQVNRDTHFKEDLGYDSLDYAEFALEIEDEYELSVPDDQVEHLQTVGQAIDWVTQAQTS